MLSNIEARWLAIAEKAFDLGQYRRAIQIYEKAVEAHPGNDELVYHLGISLREGGRVPEARKLFEGLCDREPNRSSCWFALGNTYRSTQDFSQAVECYFRALEVDPTDYEAANNLGLTYCDMGSFDEARQVLEPAFASAPDDCAYRTNLARALAGQGHNAEAVQHYEAAIAMDPAWTEYRTALVALLHKMGEHDRARQVEAEAPIDDGTQSRANEAIELAMDRDDWPTARCLIEAEMSKTEEDDHYWLTRLASTYYEQFDYAKALEISEKAMELSPECPLVLWDYACTLAMLDRDEEALAVYQHILDRGVESLAYDQCGEGHPKARMLVMDSLFRAGRCCHRLDRKDEAIEFYQRHLAERGPTCRAIDPVEDVRRALDELLS